MSPKHRADRNGERVPVTLARLEGKLDVMSSHVTHIRETTERQEEHIDLHTRQIRCLQDFKAKMRGVWVTIAGFVAIAAVVEAVLHYGWPF